MANNYQHQLNHVHFPDGGLDDGYSSGGDEDAVNFYVDERACVVIDGQSRGGWFIAGSVVVDDPDNWGCEAPCQPHEPSVDGCGGWCSRMCHWCRETEEYWAFCSNPLCYYANCNEPGVRLSSAHRDESDNILCSGCAPP